MTSALTIRAMMPAEVSICRFWAASEQWNPGRHDPDVYLSIDPAGFFVGLVNEDPVAIISAVKYSPDFAFIGHYIVKPGHRGKGYGLAIWKRAMQHVSDCSVIGLDGVPAQQANYAKSNFKHAHNNFRFEGVGGRALTPPPDPCVVPLSQIPAEELNAYDRRAFPAARVAFLALWTTREGTAALAYIRNGRLAGYGVVRESESGHRIGPLFADGDDVAEALLRALLSSAAEGAPVFIDVPDAHAGAMALVKKLGMSAGFETARMYAGAGPPDIDLNCVYGVSSLEMG
ncbi:GCN5-like N-acetyltransferase [Tribonema minus]|uniref:GCN5-like N-acetyltransferase n=1 Tax=Tribonema minus TaxID=303371 RepID=A0A836C911_9STRA|nr:GCN5-like N-acetyltransferase [Tribonema minus]